MVVELIRSLMRIPVLTPHPFINTARARKSWSSVSLTLACAPACDQRCSAERQLLWEPLVTMRYCQIIAAMSRSDLMSFGRSRTGKRAFSGSRERAVPHFRISWRHEEGGRFDRRQCQSALRLWRAELRLADLLPLLSPSSTLARGGGGMSGWAVYQGWRSKAARPFELTPGYSLRPRWGL
jgi:hypothetical protein